MSHVMCNNQQDPSLSSSSALKTSTYKKKTLVKSRRALNLSSCVCATRFQLNQLFKPFARHIPSSQHVRLCKQVDYKCAPAARQSLKVAAPTATMADKQQQWQGKASAKLTRSTADQIWPLFADFCNLHKYLGIIDTCYHVEGTPDPPQPGCVRYCSAPAVVSPDGTQTPGILAYEKLLSFDPVKRCLSYEITENDAKGFNNYVATIKVLPGDDGCVLEWGYVVDPIEGWKSEDLAAVIGSALDSVAKAMEAEVAQGSSTQA